MGLLGVDTNQLRYWSYKLNFNNFNNSNSTLIKNKRGNYMKRFLRILLPLIAVISALVYAVPTFAATTAPVTVTQTFAFIGISNSASSYTLNSDNSGTGLVAPSETYYSNPLGGMTAPSATVLDTECEWTMTNSSNIAIDLTANMADFAGAGVNSTNGNNGSGGVGASAYGAYTYISGALLSAQVILKSSASSVMLSNMLPATTTKKWGIKFMTQTGAATGGGASTSVILVTATAY
jgi:hypothetical protein